MFMSVTHKVTAPLLHLQNTPEDCGELSFIKATTSKPLQVVQTISYPPCKRVMVQGLFLSFGFRSLSSSVRCSL